MKRKDFLRYSFWAAGLSSLDLVYIAPRPADAFIWRMLFRALLRSAFSTYEIKTEQWYRNRLDVMLAEREFIRERFTEVSVAQVDHFPFGIVAASHRQDLLETNVAFAFPRIENAQRQLHY